MLALAWFGFVKNPLASVLDRKTTLFICLVGFLSFFFNAYLFIIFLIFLISSTFVICRYPGRYNEFFKSALKNSATVFLSFFIIILAIEGYLHLIQPKFLKLNRSILGDFSDYRERGFLDDQVFHKPDPGFRILGLGDSFARNLTELGQNYHDFLKTNFVEQGYKDIDIVNAGMDGTGPGYYWHILEKYGDSWRPDLVIVGFFLGNDFEELEFKYKSRGVYDIRECVDPSHRFLQFFQFKGWWSCQLVKRNLIIWWDRRNKAEEVARGAVPPEATFSEHFFLQSQRRRLWIIENINRQRLTDMFNKNSNTILHFKKWCQDRTAGLVIAIFPDQFQVDDKLRTQIIDKYGLNAESLDLAFPNRLLFDYCRQNNIECIDLLADFQEKARGKELYRVNDTHWNEAGNRLAAEIIFTYLQEHQLIKKK